MLRPWDRSHDSADLRCSSLIHDQLFANDPNRYSDVPQLLIASLPIEEDGASSVAEKSRHRPNLSMALGTAVSRATGLLRTAAILFVLGTALNSDIFENANSVPNSLYILVAGGVLNVVLVPHMIRSISQSDDAGAAFTSYIFTLVLVVLAGATLGAMILVPYLSRLIFPQSLFSPIYADQLEAAQLLMYMTLPQIFFYGAFVLLGQSLNAREKFGPMMWAPIINNVFACGAFVSYGLVFGHSGGSDGFSQGEVLLLGLGSTFGVMLQAAALLPFARAAGIRFKPRFDFRGAGLRSAAVAGSWAVGFVAVNQVGYLVALRLATEGNLGDLRGGSGSFLFGLGFLVSQVPHGIVTVTIVTAAFPALVREALEQHWDKVREAHVLTLRQCLLFLLPSAISTLVLAEPIARVVALGAARGSISQIASVLEAASLLMLTFSAHFVLLRGFYATEDTRTPFFIQCVVIALFLVSSVFITQAVAAHRVAATLLLLLGSSFAVGATLSAAILKRRFGRHRDGRTFQFVVRSAVAGAAMGSAAWLIEAMPLGGDRVRELLTVMLASAVGIGAYAVAAKLLDLRSYTRAHDLDVFPNA